MKTMSVSTLLRRLRELKKELGNADVVLEYDTLYLNAISGVVSHLDSERNVVIKIKGC